MKISMHKLSEEGESNARVNYTTKQSVKMTRSGCILYARKCKNCEKDFYSRFLHSSSLCKKCLKKRDKLRYKRDILQSKLDRLLNKLKDYED